MARRIFKKRRFSKRKGRRTFRKRYSKRRGNKTTRKMAKIAKRVVNRMAETKFTQGYNAMSWLVQETGDSEARYYNSPLNGLLNLGLYEVDAGLAPNNMIGTSIYVKYLKIRLQIQSKLTDHPDGVEVPACNTANLMTMYIIRPRNSNIQFPTNPVMREAQGFKITSGDWFKPAFYERWKIVKTINMKFKSRNCASTAEDTGPLYKDELSSYTHNLQFKVKLNQKVQIFSQEGPANVLRRLEEQKYSKRYYCYFMSSCPKWPYLGPDAGPDAEDCYNHTFSIESRSIVAYTDL